MASKKWAKHIKYKMGHCIFGADKHERRQIKIDEFSKEQRFKGTWI